VVWTDLFASVAVGLIGGGAAGLLGVSPGGPLVVFSVLLLGAEQHVAQGLSLIAQVPPTSLSGVRQYRDKGNRAPIRWLLLLALGFLAGGILGAKVAGSASATLLQWLYVLYLAALVAMLVIRGRKAPADSEAASVASIHWAALLLVGAVGGFSSGLMGIGGGLAVTVGLGAGLCVPQHQAQMISLLLAVVPTTVPAAWIYWQQGRTPAWPVVIGTIAGLWLGTYLGACLANQVSATVLHRGLIVLVGAMAAYMAYKALGA
jgi:uncharacterized protein